MRTAAGLALAALLLVGACGDGPSTTPAPAPVPSGPTAVATTPPTDQAAVSLDGVGLAVTGFHLLRPDPGDAEALQAAAAQGVPVDQLAQLHLLLRLSNTGSRAEGVAGDGLQLAVGDLVLDPATDAVFPLAPLLPGEQQETAVGFDVVVRAGTGPVVLHWTHGGRTVAVPLGAARQAA